MKSTKDEWALFFYEALKYRIYFHKISMKASVWLLQNESGCAILKTGKRFAKDIFHMVQTIPQEGKEMDFIKRTWAEIELNDLEFNINSIKKATANGAMICGVVKGDSYGNGDVVAAKMYDKMGAKWLAVASLSEAINLRNEGLKNTILILGFTAPQLVPELVKYNITQTVVGFEHAQHLQAEAAKIGAVLEVNIAVNSGMTRIGFTADENEFETSKAQILEVSKMPNLKVTGIFTHFAVSDTYDEDNDAFTRRQYARFKKMCDELQAAGMDVGVRHCANSAAIIMYPEFHLDMVRAGVITNGIYPSDPCRSHIELKPLLKFKTIIGLVRHIKAGAQLSYGRTFTAEKDMTVAVVPVGYTDGYFRNLSNKGRMLVNGQFAPVCGRICMDQCIIDITGIDGVKEGDEVVIIGKQGNNEITADEVGATIGTIAHEVNNVVGKRVPRVYTRNGVIVGVVDYVLKRFDYPEI